MLISSRVYIRLSKIQYLPTCFNIVSSSQYISFMIVGSVSFTPHNDESLGICGRLFLAAIAL